jgi:exodeoxyribonuclease VII small subunit
MDVALLSIMSARTTGGDGEAGYDQVIERLRAVVERLEAGNLSLEQSLAAFEEGVRLSRRGSEILDRAERRVEVLQRGEGGEQVVPFVEGPGEGEGGTS